MSRRSTPSITLRPANRSRRSAMCALTMSVSSADVNRSGSMPMGNAATRVTCQVGQHMDQCVDQCGVTSARKLPLRLLTQKPATSISTEPTCAPHTPSKQAGRAAITARSPAGESPWLWKRSESAKRARHFLTHLAVVLHPLRRAFQSQDARARRHEVARVVVRVEADQICLEHAAKNLLAPGQRSVYLRARERRMQKPAHLKAVETRRSVCTVCKRK
jgi:hypothetical protein